MNLEEIHYDAFISYRHAPVDSFVAKNIHRRLESFKVPGVILKSHPELKDGIKRVFRDEEELPLATNLSDPITEALKNSEFLIVICTPRLLESKWCMKELDTFIELHGREKVLAVLAEGEPSESFPKQLLSKEVIKTDIDGNEIKVVEEVEPLAADVRGSNEREIIRNMKDDIIRLAAAMLGLNYDDLKRRHHEQKLKRTIGICSAITAVFVIFGAVSFTQAMRISNQAKEIEAQNEQIMAQNEQIMESNEAIKAKSDEIEAQNKVISEKNDVITEKLIASVADGANSDAESGKVEKAWESIKAAVEGIDNAEAVNSSSDLLYAMTNIKWPYSIGEDYSPRMTYDTASTVSKIVFSDDCKHFLTLDESNSLCIWDTKTGEKVHEVKDVVRELGNGCDFLTDDKVLYNTYNGSFVFSISGTKETKIDEGENIAYKIANDKYRKYELFGKGICEEALMCPDTEATLSIYDGFEDKDVYAEFECKGNNKTIKLNASLFEEIIQADGRFYVSTYDYSDLYYTTNWSLTCISATDGEVLWKKDVESNSKPRNLTYLADGDAKYVCVTEQRTFVILDADSGEIKNRGEASCDIVFATVPDELPRLVGILEDATSVVFQPKFDGVYVISNYSLTPKNTVTDAAFAGGNIFLQFKGENYITRYSKKKADAMESIDEEEFNKYTEAYTGLITDDGIYEVKDEEYEKLLSKVNISPEVVTRLLLSGDGKYLVACEMNCEVCIIDLETQEIAASIYCPYSLPFALQSLPDDKGYILAVNSRRNLLLDNEMNIMSAVYYCCGYDEENNRLIFKDGDLYYACHMYSVEDMLKEYK